MEVSTRDGKNGQGDMGLEATVMKEGAVNERREKKGDRQLKKER